MRSISRAVPSVSCAEGCFAHPAPLPLGTRRWGRLAAPAAAAAPRAAATRAAVQRLAGRRRRLPRRHRLARADRRERRRRARRRAPPALRRRRRKSRRGRRAPPAYGRHGAAAARPEGARGVLAPATAMATVAVAARQHRLRRRGAAGRPDHMRRGRVTSLSGALGVTDRSRGTHRAHEAARSDVQPSASRSLLRDAANAPSSSTSPDIASRESETAVTSAAPHESAANGPSSPTRSSAPSATPTMNRAAA